MDKVRIYFYRESDQTLSFFNKGRPYVKRGVSPYFFERIKTLIMVGNHVVAQKFLGINNLRSRYEVGKEKKGHEKWEK